MITGIMTSESSSKEASHNPRLSADLSESFGNRFLFTN
jgi:hypothetical protein